MTIPIINPRNGKKLRIVNDHLVDGAGNIFPIVKGVARISRQNNYTDNFGMQWNKFDKTQLDREGHDLSLQRFFFLKRIGINKILLGKMSLKLDQVRGVLVK